MISKQNTERIVFIIGSMGKGGAERVISILANSYAEKGWEVDIITLLDDIVEYELNSVINIIPICNSKSRIKQLPNWMLGIRKYVKRNKPDRIISFFARINIITLLSCIGLKQHIIISERSDPKADGRSNCVRIATYLLYPLSNCIVFQTKWAQSCFSKSIQNKSIIISNPIDVSEEALSNKKKKIVSVGRLIEEKNHSMLISAFKRVNDYYPGYKLFIYGEGRLREALTKQVENLNLLNKVALPGNVSKIHEHIADTEIFVLTSKHEGLPNALLEAMMMGLPCISTNFSSVSEIIINNYNGIVVDLESEDQLFNAICNFIDNKEHAYMMGQKGKETVQPMKKQNIIMKWQRYIEENS